MPDRRRRSLSCRRLLPVVLLAALTGCAAGTALATSATVDGAWELVASRAYRGDSLLYEVRPPQVRAIKVLSGGRFSYVTARQDGSLVRAGAGRYLVAGTTYTETLDLASADPMRGRSYPFTMRIENGVWHHGGAVEGVRLEEEWRRAGP
ncbi:MAG TPA: hypothetical protein VEA99_16495 [Gemmatimonadaceae bacterium]|nr:hypothetical protein [Gemmatimonadaceae bacterium]